MFDAKAPEGVRERAIRDYVVASAHMLDLEIEPDWHDQVVTNFGLLAAAAASINSVPLSDSAESALAFIA